LHASRWRLHVSFEFKDGSARRYFGGWVPALHYRFLWHRRVCQERQEVLQFLPRKDDQRQGRDESQSERRRQVLQGEEDLGRIRRQVVPEERWRRGAVHDANRPDVD